MTGIRRRDFVAGAAATLPLLTSRARAQERLAEPAGALHRAAGAGRRHRLHRAPVGDVLTRTLGQQIVVENRTGAGGTLGMDLGDEERA